MEYKHLNGNGLKIGAAIEGEGPLIVLVHGWPESWYSWRHQIPFLASLGYKVAAIDVRDMANLISLMKLLNIR